MNAVVVAAVFGACVASADDAKWVEATKSGDGDNAIVIYNREKAGSDIKEVMAIGTFDRAPADVHAVLDDLSHYKDFMPYAQESKELAKGDGFRVTYELIAAPLSDKRDYAIKVVCTNDAVAGSITHTFSLAPSYAPAVKDGVVRIQVLEGHWVLEPKDGGKRTKATYYVYTDPGGAIPRFVANLANNTAVPGLYEAVRKRLATIPRGPTPPTTTAPPAVPPAPAK